MSESNRFEELVESWKPYFAEEYQRDGANARRQSFDEYWGWVKSFLLVGGSGYAGWLAQTMAALARIHDPARSKQLGERAQSLGKRIAREWAKDGAIRRIYSNPFQGRPNLLDWGRKLQRAAREDRGDGQLLEAALVAMEADLAAIG